MTDIASPPKPNWFSRLAHPGSFMAWSKPAIVPLALSTAALFLVGLYLAFFRAPRETEKPKAKPQAPSTPAAEPDEQSLSTTERLLRRKRKRQEEQE